MHQLCIDRLDETISFTMICILFHQLASNLKSAETKRPSLKKKGLSESEYLDVIEDVCDTAWEK